VAVGSAALAGGALVACGSAAAPAIATSLPVPTTILAPRLTVLAVTTQIDALTKRVGGDRIDLDVILKANVDPHEYEPVPEDIKKIGQSRLILRHGLLLDKFLDKLIADPGSQKRTVVVTSGITLLKLDAEDDPHVWFSVPNAMKMVQNIAAALGELDSANGPYFQANAEKYLGELKTLDDEIKQKIAQIAPDRRKLVTTHDAFGYLCDRYGLTLVGTVMPGFSTEQQPSAQQIADTVKTIKAQHVPAIFVESSVNPKLTEQVAKESGAKVINTLYSDTLGPPGSDADTYDGMMRHDIDTIASALR
jgi:ABC-type Zn uptake system ZnuABC Zn-binding protein ZnuA